MYRLSVLRHADTFPLENIEHFFFPLNLTEFVMDLELIFRHFIKFWIEIIVSLEAWCI